MKKALLFGACALVAAAAAANAGGKSDTAQIHPGHQGKVASENKGGGLPAAEYHENNNEGYQTGPGGWGDAVSDAAKTNKGKPDL